MKRVRELDAIRADLVTVDSASERLWRCRRALRAELAAHPEHAAAERRARRAALERALPPALHRVLLDADGAAFGDLGALASLEVSEELAPDAAQWTCELAFARGGARVYTAESSAAPPLCVSDFAPVPFFGNARVLWLVAREANGDDAGAALAALCYACCVELQDFDAAPAAAFAPLPVSKAKDEIERPL